MAKLLGHDLVTLAELEAFDMKVIGDLEKRIASLETGIKKLRDFIMVSALITVVTAVIVMFSIIFK